MGENLANENIRTVIFENMFKGVDPLYVEPLRRLSPAVYFLGTIMHQPCCERRGLTRRCGQHVVETHTHTHTHQTLCGCVGPDGGRATTLLPNTLWRLFGLNPVSGKSCRCVSLFVAFRRFLR